MVQQTVIWGTFCGLALVASLWRPKAARIGLGVFFIIMAVGVNGVYALLSPDGFVKLGTDAPLLEPYRWAFANVVAIAPAAFGLATAAFEATIGVLLIRGGHQARLALVAGIIFLVISSALGPWALPNLILAVVLGVLLVKQHHAPSRVAGFTARPVLR
ncbi:MAG: hypothetical protein WCG47_20905 [Dermatophilaceae bacterium]